MEMSEIGTSDSEPLGFSIKLLRMGSEGSAFRTQNTPGEFQRENLVDRSSDFVVQGGLVNVIHGSFSPGGDEATLIVAEFRFHSSKASRRFRQANIELLFSGSRAHTSDGSRDPEVVKVSPMGKNSLNPTYESQELKRTIGATAEVNGGSLLPVKVGGNVIWEDSKSFDKEYRATVTGVMRIEGRNYGSKNQANWVMLENKSAANRDGIPTLLRTAILLRRKYAGIFTATIQIKTKVDTKNSIYSKLENLLGKTPKDDPVFFNPDLPPMGTVPSDMEIGNLSGYDLGKLSTVVSTNLIPTAAAGTILSYIPMTALYFIILILKVE